LSNMTADRMERQRPSPPAGDGRADGEGQKMRIFLGKRAKMADWETLDTTRAPCSAGAGLRGISTRSSRQHPFFAGDAAVGCAGGWVSKLMSSRVRKRLNRLERRCDWLQARIAIGEAEGRDMNADVAALSAVRGLIDTFGTQYFDLVAENHSLKHMVSTQRRAIQDPAGPAEAGYALRPRTRSTG
jgi:hypothetical protein